MDLNRAGQDRRSWRAVMNTILMKFISYCYNSLTINYKLASYTTALLYLIMYATCFGHVLTIFRH